MGVGVMVVYMHVEDPFALPHPVASKLVIWVIGTTLGDEHHSGPRAWLTLSTVRTNNEALNATQPTALHQLTNC